MAQLYAQQDRQPDVWVMSGAPSATVVYLSLPTTVNYSDGASDTLPANTPAAIVGGGTSFNRTDDVYVPFVYKGDPTLRIIKESLLPTLTSDYHPMARVELHGIKPYQPEPYLASGGLGTSAPSTTTVVSTTAALALALWNGASNNAPPSGWQTPAFDDSAWTHAVVVTAAGAPASPLSDGSYALWHHSGALSTNEQALFRHHISLPAGTIIAASVNVWAPLDGIWVNGTFLAGSVYDGPRQAYPIAPSALVAGGDNTLGIWAYNDGTAAIGQAVWMVYILTVTYAGSTSVVATAGTAAEGDLLYSHGGAWVDLPIGGSGKVLTSDGTDPAWSTPTGGTVTSVALAAPSPLSSAGGPITASGTITLSWASGQSANRVLASPDGTTGAVSLRALVGNDIPVDASTIVSSAGVIKGNYQAGSGVSISGNTITATGSGGSVTSVALSMPGIFSVSGSPISTSGTLSVTLANENVATVFAGPASGSAAAPTFRALAATDLPAAASAGGHIHAHGHFL